jgi:hypothetical protein
MHALASQATVPKQMQSIDTDGGQHEFFTCLQSLKHLCSLFLYHLCRPSLQQSSGRSPAKGKQNTALPICLGF